MNSRECYHCGQVLSEAERKTHDCWTTTEENLTRDLPDDIREAFARLRETAVSFGEQRIYASHKSIMFSRKSCYFFVRPKKAALEIVFFVGRIIKSPAIAKTYETSKTKRAHILYVSHRDEVESPITDWLKEAYDVSPTLGARAAVKKKPMPRKKKKTRKARASASR